MPEPSWYITTGTSAAMVILGLWAKECLDKRKSASTDHSTFRVAEMDRSEQAREFMLSQSLDQIKSQQDTIKSLNERIVDLTRRVDALDESLERSKEGRKIADLSADAAHIRADGTEALISKLRSDIQVITNQRDLAVLSTATKGIEIDRLLARVRELENILTNLEHPKE